MLSHRLNKRCGRQAAGITHLQHHPERHTKYENPAGDFMGHLHTLSELNIARAVLTEKQPEAKPPDLELCRWQSVHDVRRAVCGRSD